MYYDKIEAIDCSLNCTCNSMFSRLLVRIRKTECIYMHANALTLAAAAPRDLNGESITHLSRHYSTEDESSVLCIHSLFSG